MRTGWPTDGHPRISVKRKCVMADLAYVMLIIGTFAGCAAVLRGLQPKRSR